MFVMTEQIHALEAMFKERLQYDVPLARFTAARIGGPAEVFLAVQTAQELALAVRSLWESATPFLILGGGSNLLVSDRGVPGVVLLNRARAFEFRKREPPRLWAESGANFGALARQAAQKGLAGLAWAGGVPGTVGGAVVGNAGAHGGDMAGTLLEAEVIHRHLGRQTLAVADLEYGYRDSLLKRNPDNTVVLSAELGLQRSSPEQVRSQMAEYLAHRRRTQPPGASMGSMFKNPPGDYAGRLIEAAGLKGVRRGDAQISELHANFFINHGRATAADVRALIEMARERVAAGFDVQLDLEIELVGAW